MNQALPKGQTVYASPRPGLSPQHHVGRAAAELKKAVQAAMDQGDMGEARRILAALEQIEALERSLG